MEHALTPDPFDALPRPRRRPQEHGRTPFDGLRPWSAITHGIGAALAILGTILLLVKAVMTGADAWKLVSFSIYGASMIGLYTASTLYHSVHTTASKRIALRKYDHASIYFLIAGTYTPVCLTALRGPWGWSMFGIIWALAIAGLVMTLAWINCPRWLTLPPLPHPGGIRCAVAAVRRHPLHYRRRALRSEMACPGQPPVWLS